MVTLAVAAVLLIAAAPSFADLLDRYRLRGATDDVVSLFANARAESVKADADVFIQFGGAGTDDWCVGANAASAPTGGNPGDAAVTCNCRNTAQCMVAGIRSVADGNDHSGVEVDTNVASFVFDSKLGTVVATGVIADPNAVTFTSPSGKYQIAVDVNALGQSTVCTPAGQPTIAGVAEC